MLDCETVSNRKTVFPRDTMENRRTFLPFLRGFIVASKKAVVRSIPSHSKRRPSRPGNRAHDRYLAKKKKKKKK